MVMQVRPRVDGARRAVLAALVVLAVLVGLVPPAGAARAPETYGYDNPGPESAAAATDGYRIATEGIPDPELDSEGERYVRRKHVQGGADTAGNSVFNAGVDLHSLVETSASVPPCGPNGDGNYERDFDTGEIIGTRGETGVRVVQDRWGAVRTMHPI